MRGFLGKLETFLSLARIATEREAEKDAHAALVRWKGQVFRSLLSRSEGGAASPEEKQLLGRLRACQQQLSDTLYEPAVVESKRAPREATLERLRKTRNKLELDLSRMRGEGEGRAEIKSGVSRFRQRRGVPGSGVAEIHEIANGAETPRLFLEKKTATEERIKNEMPNYQYIHLATHGYFQPEGLPSMWKNSEEDGSERGQIEMREKERVITGLLPGLLSGLVFSGANADPERGKLSALRTAPLEMLRRNRAEDGEGLPSTWGAFVLDGDWR